MFLCTVIGFESGILHYTTMMALDIKTIRTNERNTSDFKEKLGKAKLVKRIIGEDEYADYEDGMFKNK